MAVKRKKNPVKRVKVNPKFPRRAKLDRLIDAYLKKRSYSTGGWAPVSDQDMEQLSGILSALVHGKYSADPDGDRPINWILIDRTTCEPLHYEPLPYSPRTIKECETAQGMFTESMRFELATYNLSIALGGMKDVSHPIMKHMKELVKASLEMEAEEKTQASPVDVVR